MHTAGPFLVAGKGEMTMTMTKKHRQMLVIALIVALLAGMFVPMSPVYATTESGEEELILEGESGEINLTGEELPENSQLLFATSVMSVDTSVQLDTQSKIYYDNWFTSRYRVKVNGEVCTLRGKKLFDGDEFSFDGRFYKIVKE